VGTLPALNRRGGVGGGIEGVAVPFSRVLALSSMAPIDGRHALA
jgi:hypothetical protein